MPTINTIIRNILIEQGRTQQWVYTKMNEINPELDLNSSKFSALVNGNRKMTGDELLAFCQALNISPDIFIEREEIA